MLTISIAMINTIAGFVSNFMETIHDLKKGAIVLIIIGIAACHSKSAVEKDKTDKNTPGIYTPGLGEFMTDMQAHHLKLWYAGKASNWKLADFELDEIKETGRYLQKFCADRPEVKSYSILQPALDSVATAITEESLPRFKHSFSLLTAGCNSCHHATHFEFNVIRIPKSNPYTNQEFGKPITEKAEKNE